MDIEHIFQPNLNNELLALKNMGYTINNLAKVFDKQITKRLYNDLSDEIKKNLTYLSLYFCNDLGKFSMSFRNIWKTLSNIWN